MEIKQQTEQQKNVQQYYSYALILGSCFFWVSGYIYSNNNNLSAFQTSMLRGFAIVVGSYIICKYKREPIDYKNQLKILSIRNILMMACGMMVAWSQFYLPLSIVHTLLSTGSLFVFLLQYLLEGKKAGTAQLIGMLVSFLGIVLVANGGIISQKITGSKFQSKFQNYKSTDPLVSVIFSVLLLITQMTWAYTVLLTKKVNVSPFQMNFNFGFICLICNAILYIFQSQKAEGIVLYQGIIWTGLCLFGAEVCFVGGIMMSVYTGRTMIVGFMTVVVGYLYSILLYGESLNFICLLGSIAIIVGVSKIILS